MPPTLHFDDSPTIENRLLMSNVFWYSREEPEHVEKIFQIFTEFLKLNENISKNSRVPKKFIGKICRHILVGDNFETINQIFIYTQENKALDSDMVPKQIILTKSSWNVDGLPTDIQIIKQDLYKREGEDTYLYCLPEFCSKTFHFFSTLQNFKVCYSDKYNFLLNKVQTQMKSLKDKYSKSCCNTPISQPMVKITFSVLGVSSHDDEDDDDYEEEEEEEEEWDDDEEEEEDYIEEEEEVNYYSYDFDEGCSKKASFQTDYLNDLLSPISPHLKNNYRDFDEF
eukprot:gene9725-1929_t